ncbi:MAG: hypothetical protein E2598_09980 [Sphingobium sp.]|nr:hypothetical protein [Sphingobium sp.]
MMSRTAWNAAMAQYNLAALVRDAAGEFGPLFRGEQLNIANEYMLEQKYGCRSAAAKGTETRAAYDAEAFRHEALMDPYYEKYGDPKREAAQALVKIPAPDLDALRFKVDLIKSEELYCYVGTEDAFDYVEADAQRLSMKEAA